MIEGRTTARFFGFNKTIDSRALLADSIVIVVSQVSGFAPTGDSSLNLGYPPESEAFSLATGFADCAVG